MRIIWSAPALADLRKIDHWLQRDDPPEVALRTISAIKYRAGFLKNFPRGGRPHHDRERVLLVIDTPYLIRYRITDDVVEVIRVHHERENWHVAR